MPLLMERYVVHYKGPAFKNAVKEKRLRRVTHRETEISVKSLWRQTSISEDKLQDSCLKRQRRG